MSKTFLLALLCLLFTNIYTQSLRTEKIKIFLDCNQEWLCDGDFLRNEMKMVDFVRDRFLCDVQVISNVQFSNGGGETNTLQFKGQKDFANMESKLQFFNDVTATEDAKRKKMLQYLKMGLMPYIGTTSFGDKIEINYTGADSVSTKPTHDPWNFWQFSIGSSGFFNGDKNYSSQSISNNFTASRETEKSKFYLSFNNNLNRNEFNFYNDDLDSTETIKVTNDRQNIYSNYSIKWNDHWANGIEGYFNRSIFDNIDARFGISPSVEYSIFPYKDFNNKRIVLFYSLGPQFSDYRDTTIYFKTKEILLQQSFGLNSSFTQEWGSINLGANLTNYLDDLQKHSLFVGGAVSWNIFKGFKFSVGGNYILQHDQISLPKFGASRDDVLTQRRLIGSSYSYFAGIGFSYSFGSIYNSQVNPTYRGLSYNLSF